MSSVRSRTSHDASVRPDGRNRTKLVDVVRLVFAMWGRADLFRPWLRTIQVLSDALDYLIAGLELMHDSWPFPHPVAHANRSRPLARGCKRKFMPLRYR